MKKKELGFICFAIGFTLGMHLSQYLYYNQFGKDIYCKEYPNSIYCTNK